MTEELVVATCKEDLSWIDDHARTFDKVTVYDKCGEKPTFKSPNVEVQSLPNIGSCDNAFLTYIVDRYDSLPNKVEFTKGSAPPNHKYLECVHCPARDCGVLNMKLHDWKFSHNRSQEFPFVPTPYKDMREWVENHDVLSPRVFEHTCCNIIYMGHFGATREQIHNANRETYESLRSEQHHTNEEVDHFIERTWRPLFCHKHN